MVSKMRFWDNKSPQWPSHFEANITGHNKEQRLSTRGESRRVFCGNLARFSATLAFLPLAESLAGCNSQPKKRIVHSSVQINNTDVITNARYIGDAFTIPDQELSVSLMPQLNILSSSAQGFSFLGIIAQDTLSDGFDAIQPQNILLVGMFKQKNGTFRYGYEINGVRNLAKENMQGSDYHYTINLHLNEEGLVTDPDYPNQRRFGYDFQISTGSDVSIRIQGLQSSSIQANQLFVGVMDESNNVQIPDGKQLQLHIVVTGTEQEPGVIYKNGDDTSQVSSKYSNDDDSITLTLSGSY